MPPTKRHSGRRGGVKVEFRIFVLGATRVVYEHNDHVLEWMGVDMDKTRRDALKNMAENGAREASAMLATFDKLEVESLGARGAVTARVLG